MVFLYPGAIHIHSIYSDGTETVEDIASAAKKAGLNWIIITDHDNLEAKEGIYDGVCVIVGEEISPAEGDHYIALGIRKPISSEIEPKCFVEEVKKQGGFGFIAHPDEKVSRKNSYKPLRWQNWELDFDGIEIWNFLSNWGDYYNEKNFFKAIYAFLFRNKVLSGPTEKTLNCWDNLNNKKEKIVPAIGGVDAHAIKIKKYFVTVKIFPYENTFKSITNFINLDEAMPDDFENRKKIILEAIKTGRNLIINRFGNSKLKCPEIYIENKNKKTFSGGEIESDEKTKIIVNLPRNSTIKLFQNGKTIFEKKTKNLSFKVREKGKYRIEVYYKNRPWIFSNPIRVVDNQ